MELAKPCQLLLVAIVAYITRSSAQPQMQPPIMNGPAAGLNPGQAGPDPALGAGPPFAQGPGGAGPQPGPPGRFNGPQQGPVNPRMPGPIGGPPGPGMVNGMLMPNREVTINMQAGGERTVRIQSRRQSDFFVRVSSCGTDEVSWRLEAPSGNEEFKHQANQGEQQIQQPVFGRKKRQVGAPGNPLGQGFQPGIGGGPQPNPSANNAFPGGQGAGPNGLAGPMQNGMAGGFEQGGPNPGQLPINGADQPGLMGPGNPGQGGFNQGPPGQQMGGFGQPQQPGGLGGGQFPGGPMNFPNAVAPQQADQYRVPASSLRMPPAKRIPPNFDIELVEPHQDTGMGTPIGNSIQHDVDQGEEGVYTLTVGNPHSFPMGARIFLSAMTSNNQQQQQQFILPDNPNIRVEAARFDSLSLTWEPVEGPNGNTMGQAEYCVKYRPMGPQAGGPMGGPMGGPRGGPMGPMGPMTPQTCGVQSGPRMGQQQQCTRANQLRLMNLRPSTRYVIDLVARDPANRQETRYISSNVSTLEPGIQLQNNREISNVTMPPRSMQTFTLDTTSSPGGSNVEFIVFPCQGLVTWAVMRDGMVIETYEPDFMDDNSFSDDDNFDLGDNDNDMNDRDWGEMPDTGDNDNNPVGPMGRMGNRWKRQLFLDGPQQPQGPFPQQGGNGFPPPGGMRPRMGPPPMNQMPGGRNFNNRRPVGQPNRQRFDSGQGRSMGQSVFQFDEEMPTGHLYQVVVFNQDPNQWGRFNIFASGTPEQSPYPRMPTNPQLRVVDSGDTHLNVQWNRSPSPNTQYCVVARQRNNNMASGMAGMRFRRQMGGGMPGFGGPGGPGMGGPGMGGPMGNMLGVQQVPSSPCAVQGREATQALMTQGMCSREPSRRLSNLQPGASYSVETFAVNEDSYQAMSYIGVMAYASSSIALSPLYMLTMLLAILTLCLQHA